VFGYLMIRFRFPRVTLVIALVLGEVAERSFYQSLNISDGHWTIFFTRGMSLGILAITVACLAIPALRAVRRHSTRAVEAAG
jgi:putative tricarboxylic transport membrane protein